MSSGKTMSCELLKYKQKFACTEALESNASVITLNLMQNNISDVGGTAIAKAFG